MIPVTGCVTYPCDEDVLECKEGDALQVDASCEADGTLTVEILEMDTLTPVAEDAWPTVHEGPQGGHHFNLALRVTGLEPDHVALSLQLDALECTDEACDDSIALGHRVLNADDTILEADGDGFVVHDVVVMLERPPEAGGMLYVDANDACGQRARLQLRAQP